MDQPIYIHYGSSKYDPNHFVTPRNSDGRCIYNKPLGGLWASRTDSDYGWKNWCEDNEFHTDNLSSAFKFKLRDDAF